MSIQRRLERLERLTPRKDIAPETEEERFRRYLDILSPFERLFGLFVLEHEETGVVNKSYLSEDEKKFIAIMDGHKYGFCECGELSWFIVVDAVKGDRWQFCPDCGGLRFQIVDPKRH